MKFKQLNLSEWQQFQGVNIDFHPQLTILTGANGSGKTTILEKILAKHCGWHLQSCATPKKEKSSGILKFFSRLWNGENKNEQAIGELIYENGQKASINVPNQDTPQYQINLTQQQSVRCLLIPYNRPIYRYQAVSNIPVTKKTKQSAYEEVSNATKSRYEGNNIQSASSFMKNILIGWAIQGYGNEVIERDAEQISHYEGFQHILKKILPKSLKFQALEIRKMEIVFICNDKKDEFIFEQASGGISALIDLAWQIYMFSTKEDDDFTVMIDEVENHLHPTMQREIMPNLLSAFPKISFVISTHSPLVVGSVQNSNVYAFKYNKDGKISSEKLDLVNQAKTATEILNEVLGVSFTMPIWAEEKLKAIVNTYSSKEMTQEDFSSMRQELKGMGLEKLVPEAITNIIETKND